MPALRVFGRRWLIAEDDVPVPAFFMAVYHLLWMPPIISWFAMTYGSANCGMPAVFGVAVSGLLASFGISIALEIAAIVVGCRGSIFERRPRRFLPYIIYADTASHVLQLAFTWMLTWISGGMDTFPPGCSDADGVWNPSSFLNGLSIATWIYLALTGIIVIALFNSHPDYHEVAAWAGGYMSMFWIGFCCWNPFSAKQRMRQRERARRVGANLCSLFGHADTTLTDMLAAYIVARALYERDKRQAQKQNLENERNSDNALGLPAIAYAKPPFLRTMTTHLLGNDVEAPPPALPTMSWPAEPYRYDHSKSAPVDAITLKEAAHFFPYAYAVYGWMCYVLEHGAGGLADILFGCVPPGTHVRAHKLLGPWGWGRTNVKVVRRALDCPHGDVLFLREEGALTDVLCYFIAIDHSTRSVVLAVRGAMSIQDNVKDVMFEAASLEEWLDQPWSWTTPPRKVREVSNRAGDSPLGHAEYLRAAARTLEDIQRQGVLREAMSGPAAKYPGYKLVVTGHSLGACVAYLMSLRLRKAFPDLRCWAFSPPLGLVSTSVGAAAEDWCTTVACGKEIVPRYSVLTLDRARDQLMMAAAKCRAPKLNVLLRSMWGGWDAHASELTRPEFEIPQEVREMLEEYRRSVDADEHRRHLLETAGQFGLPGRVLYMRSTGRKHRVSNSWGCKETTVPCCCCCGRKQEREHEAVWVDREHFAREGLVFSGRALADHMPNTPKEVLAQLVARQEGATLLLAEQESHDVTFNPALPGLQAKYP